MKYETIEGQWEQQTVNKMEDLAKVTLVIPRADGKGGSICGPAGPVKPLTVAIPMGLVLWVIGDPTNQVVRARATCHHYGTKDRFDSGLAASSLDRDWCESGNMFGDSSWPSP